MADIVDIAFDGHQVVVRGKTYDIRDTIKSAGFSWDKQNKQWYLLSEDGEGPIDQLKKTLESGFNIQVYVHNLS